MVKSIAKSSFLISQILFAKFSEYLQVKNREDTGKNFSSFLLSFWLHSQVNPIQRLKNHVVLYFYNRNMPNILFPKPVHILIHSSLCLLYFFKRNLKSFFHVYHYFDKKYEMKWLYYRADNKQELVKG